MFTPFAALALTVSSLSLPVPLVPRLVELLGSSAFPAREAAGRALVAAGEPALPALKTATRSTDPEVARRAAALVAAITRRADNARTLAPTPVELDVTDRPLGDVLPLLEGQTGYRFQVSGVGRALSTKVTLSTNGPVPFWVAMDKLAAAAGLTPASEYQAITVLSPDAPLVFVRGGRRVPAGAQTQQLLVPTRTVVLRPKPSNANPLSYAGAVRVEAVPFPSALFPSFTGDTVGVVLQAMPEPKLSWERVQSFWVTRATDERGRELATVADTPGETTRVQPVQGGRVVFDAGGNMRVVPDGDRGRADPAFVPNAAQTLVRLKFEEEPPKSLREFEGVIRVVVQSGTEDLVATQPGRAATGLNGVSLIASEPVPSEEPFSDAAEFTVTLRYNAGDVRFEGGQPGVMETVWVGGGRAMMRQQVNAAVFVNGKRVTGAGATPRPSLHGLTVTDEAGKPYLLAVSTSRREIDQATNWTVDELKLVLKPSEPGQGKPTKVTFAAGRSKTVDIPFKLRDVPLTVGNEP